MDRQFKRLRDHEKIELESYIKNYIEQYPDAQVLIGTDSQNKKRETLYAIVVALYRPGKGGHVLYSRFTEPRYFNGRPGEVEKQRLLTEVWYSIETAERIRNVIGVKAKYIDIDINYDVKFKSNVALAEAIGSVLGMGYEVRYKKGERNAMITYAADQLVK